MRYFWSILILLCVVAWLVLSYAPGLSSHLPSIGFATFGVAVPLTGAAVAVLGLGAAIQAWLVYATVRVLRHPEEERLAAALQLFKLKAGTEALLTALPVLMTLALAAIVLFGAR